MAVGCKGAGRCSRHKKRRGKNKHLHFSFFGFSFETLPLLRNKLQTGSIETGVNRRGDGGRAGAAHHRVKSTLRSAALEHLRKRRFC